MAAPPGLEPRKLESESSVLPIRLKGNIGFYYIVSYLTIGAGTWGLPGKRHASPLVGRVRVERTSSDFQSGAPTLYATDPYIEI